MIVLFELARKRKRSGTAKAALSSLYETKAFFIFTEVIFLAINIPVPIQPDFKTGGAT
ncbi:MAG TPA: hypothetical protein PKX46_02490 [Clostridia bacterium]|nr:hypothetical protein [Clostridia bacterium]HOR12768.1 hypothetical protein [Clostridia bacterium]